MKKSWKKIERFLRLVLFTWCKNSPTENLVFLSYVPSDIPLPFSHRRKPNRVSSYWLFCDTSRITMKKFLSNPLFEWKWTKSCVCFVMWYSRKKTVFLKLPQFKRKTLRVPGLVHFSFIFYFPYTFPFITSFVADKWECVGKFGVILTKTK